jgi:endonuclease YncB( thermonuclease family)
MYTYKSKVTKVYDGDTITVEVDLGFSNSQTFRLLRINCPEVRGESREEGLKAETD